MPRAPASNGGVLHPGRTLAGKRIHHPPLRQKESLTQHLQRQLNKLRPIRQRERNPGDPRVKAGTEGWEPKPIPARDWRVVATRNLSLASDVRMMDAEVSSTTLNSLRFSFG